MHFIDFIQAIVFGIVQGITEWLPISSTGHMLLLDEIWPLAVTERFRELFFVVIQLGSVLAVLVLYFHRLNPFSQRKSKEERSGTWMLWAKVVVASIPVAVIGLLFDDWINAHFFNWKTVAIALAFYGVLYIVLERWRRNTPGKIASVAELDWKSSLFIGMFQALAVVPGTSRSGSTILGGIIVGTDRTVAAEFSFFLAIPAMAGASLLKALKIGFDFSASEWGLLLVASLTAFAVSLVAMKFLVGFVKRHDFSAFGWYRIALSVVVSTFFLSLGH